MRKVAKLANDTPFHIFFSNIEFPIIVGRMGFKFWFQLILKLFLASIKEIALKICKKEILGQPLKLSSHKVRLHLASFQEILLS